MKPRRLPRDEQHQADVAWLRVKLRAWHYDDPPQVAAPPIPAEVEACRSLWAAVLGVAVVDLDAGADEARRWFASDSEALGSFEWVCLVLDVAPGWFRGQLTRRRA